MAENLDVETYRNGDPIMYAENEKELRKFTKNKIGCWCYREEVSDKIKYGKQYNLYAVNDSRGFAPYGFRVPLKEDWERLFKNLDGVVNNYGWVETPSASEVVKKLETYGFNLTMEYDEYAIFWIGCKEIKLYGFFKLDSGEWSVSESGGKELKFNCYPVRCIKDSNSADFL
jgi:uncharacterized protein (TIGR02145 family)